VAAELPEAGKASSAPASARPHPADRFATIALLAYGLVNVVMTGISYLDLPTVLTEVMKILGIDGEFTEYAAGRAWGTAAAVVLVIGWTVTAVLSGRRLRRGRITWWLPLVGAVVTSFLAAICVMIAMMGDPAFANYIVKAGS